ncbi:UNKNOWN [Stylonychia lemnae]|uniref:Uncharacterized protein n=1 Tax=Stylonychia lemnae TaxID=5949 RepID=A0A078A6J1_STYLE|nr:UNKNOWN [Stylonychia lemnae]|eukprot:CDW77200.1 UNKNOWN [Stylonychia lemnae]
MLNGSISQMPYQIIIPFLPFITEYVFLKGQYGLICQAACHIGILLARIIVPRFIISFGSRLVICTGALLSLSFFIYFFYMIDKIFEYTMLPDREEYHLDSHFSVLIALSFIFGFGIFMSYEGNHLYVKHCAINVENDIMRKKKEYIYSKNYQQIIFFFRILSIVAAAFIFANYNIYLISTIHKLNHLVIYCAALSFASFVFSLIMEAPYQNPKLKNSSIFEEESESNYINRIQSKLSKNHINEHYEYEGSYLKLSQYLQKDILSNIFSMRMLKYLLHIICSASMNTMFESVAFIFISTKIRDNVQEHITRTTFFMFIPYIGIQMLFSFCTCRACYEFNDYGYQRSNRRWGSIINFLMFAGMCVLAVIFRLKEWDFYQISAQQTIGIFIGGSAYCGLCDLLFQKQRKSLAYQYQRHLSFYRATQIVEEFVKAVIQVFLFFQYFIFLDQWNFEDILGFQFFILIGLSLAIGLFLQILICLCF